MRNLNPDMTRLKKVDMRGVIVTSRSRSADYDFVSRFFAPAVGVDEDPVTGSAHSCLGPYWGGKLGKKALMAYQASPRGGILRVALKDDRVLIGGQAVTVLRADLLSGEGRANRFNASDEDRKSGSEEDRTGKEFLHSALSSLTFRIHNGIARFTRRIRMLRLS